MKIDSFETQLGPGVIIAPTQLDPRTATWLRFETQYDGDYGVSWPTNWAGAKAIQRVADELGNPEDQDAGLVILPNSDRRTMTTASLLNGLTDGAFASAVFLRIEAPDGAVTWSAAGQESSRSSFGDFAHKMTMAIEGFNAMRLHKILGATLLNGSSEFIDDALIEAQRHLGILPERDTAV